MIQINLQKANILSRYTPHHASFLALHLPVSNWTDAATASMQRLLSPAEMKKYRALFRNPRRQNLFLSGRFFAKWMIADRAAEFGMSEIMPLQLAIINKDNGVPYIYGLPDDVQMNLSISYSQNTFLIGCTTEGKIGVDLENWINPDSNLSSLVLSKHERDLINSRLFGYDREQTILLFWCLKEAILKAVGLGFTLGYLPIEFYTDSNRTQLLLADHQAVIPNDEHIKCFYDMNDYLCAVICRIGKESVYD